MLVYPVPENDPNVFIKIMVLVSGTVWYGELALWKQEADLRYTVQMGCTPEQS